MNPTSDAPADPAILLARAGWLRVLDDLHGGLCHDFNGRVSSLNGLLQIIQMEGPGDVGVTGHLEAEAASLAETVRILRALAGRVDADPEPLQAPYVLADAAALHGRHRGLEHLETRVAVADGLPPFRASRPRLLRILLIVLSHAGREAVDAEAGTLELAAWGGDDRVVMSVACGADGRAWNPSGFGAVAAILDQVLALDGGRVALEDDRVTLTLPAMVRPGV